MGARGRSRAAFCALALSAFVLTAQATTDIPPECGTRALFDAELRERLGDDAPVESVHVAIAQRSGRYRLRVEIGAELRELDDDSCSELFRAAVVVAVAMLMHDRTPPAEAAPPATPSAASAAPPSEPLDLTLGAGVGINVGTLPGPTAALELEGQLLWRYWGAALGVRYLVPSTKLDSQNRGAKLQAFGAHTAAIFRPSRAWQARLGFAAQRLNGEGQGSLETQAASVWTAGPTLGLGFVPYQQGSLWASLGAEGQLNALRGDFRILNYNQADDRVVYSVPWLSGSAFVRLGLVW